MLVTLCNSRFCEYKSITWGGYPASILTQDWRLLVSTHLLSKRPPHLANILSWDRQAVCYVHKVFSTFSNYLTGKPFNAQSLINSAVSNVICCLVFGDRYEYTDKQYQGILQDFSEIVYLEGTVCAQVRLLCEQGDANSNLFKIRIYKVSQAW